MATPTEEEETEFAASLGVAIAQWGGVENEMFLLYMTICSNATAIAFPNAYSITYETIQSIEAKVSIIDALAQFKITDSALLEEWATLENKIRRKIRRVRNKLAHWQVWRSSNEAHMPIFMAQHLYAPPHTVPNFGTAHGGAMGASQLIEHAQNFTNLSADIKAFRVKVRTWIQTLPAKQPAPQIAPLPQTEEAQTPTESSDPLQS